MLRFEKVKIESYSSCNPYGRGYGLITQNLRLLPLEGVVVLYIILFLMHVCNIYVLYITFVYVYVDICLYLHPGRKHELSGPENRAFIAHRASQHQFQQGHALRAGCLPVHCTTGMNTEIAAQSLYRVFGTLIHLSLPRNVGRENCPQEKGGM